MIYVFLTFILKVYFIVFISVVVHELFHYISSLILKKSVDGIYIGTNFLRLKVWKLHISPFIFHGYVEIEKELLLNMKKYELAIFFLSGAIGNVFLIGVSLLLELTFMNFYFLVINICFVLTSIVPFLIENNDMTAMINLLKEKKKYQVSSKMDV